jgi:2-polyprenyl-3-methyl-5-hydroxy-6-metoxy-1,4-benzoquinol methylase
MDSKLKNNTANQNINLLFELNLSDKNSLENFSKSTRDITNLNTLKCIKSGVIVLEKFVIPENYYEKNIHYSNNHADTTETVKGVIKSKPLEDDIRRFKSIEELIKGSEILDFGCGRGGFIELSNKISKRSVGLEINKVNRERINNIGFQCVKKLSELKEDKFDIITLYHVFEHLNDPINILIELQKYLKDDGTIIIEVPHARDMLLETFNLESFKKFTLWSEHLILHTRESLEAFAAHSGLYAKSIEGLQRYKISNHFNWLLNGQPSGHEFFTKLNDDNFHQHYSRLLNDINQTDTLIGFFGKKSLTIKD